MIIAEVVSSPPPLANGVNCQKGLDPMSVLLPWAAFMYVANFTLAWRKILSEGTLSDTKINFLRVGMTFSIVKQKQKGTR